MNTKFDKFYKKSDEGLYQIFRHQKISINALIMASLLMLSIKCSVLLYPCNDNKHPPPPSQIFWYDINLHDIWCRACLQE